MSMTNHEETDLLMTSIASPIPFTRDQGFPVCVWHTARYAKYISVYDEAKAAFASGLHKYAMLNAKQPHSRSVFLLLSMNTIFFIGLCYIWIRCKRTAMADDDWPTETLQKLSQYAGPRWEINAQARKPVSTTIKMVQNYPACFSDL